MYRCFSFLICVENYQLVSLINVTGLSKRNLAPLLLVKEKYQVINSKLFRALITTQTEYEMKHTPFLVSRKSALNDPCKTDTINSYIILQLK